MKAKLSMKLGLKTLAIEGDGDQKQIVKNLSFWSALPTKCSACGSDDLSLSHRETKKGAYYGLKCLSCTADLTFGQHRDGGTFFLKHDSKFEVYISKGESKETQNNTSNHSNNEEDIPF